VAAAVLVALLTACSAGEQGSATSTTQPTTTTAASPTTAAPDTDLGASFNPLVLTVNIEITETGFEPADVFVPLGRSVQLIIRNRTTAEHHYRVVGMDADNLLWFSQPDMEIQEGVSEEDHLFHHIPGFVDWRGMSPAGVEPTLEEVHAYSVGGVNDTVIFTPMSLGTFTVDDPLFPDFIGSMTVFE